MNVEYTKYIEGNNWRDLRIALNERKDNLQLAEPTEDQKLLLEKLENRPELIMWFGEFEMLTEMAVLIRKMWTPPKELKIFFYGGQNDRTKKVLSLASEWSKYCSITFAPTNKIEEADLRISFNEPFSFSCIGTDARGIPRNEATMNFGWLNSTTEPVEYKRVVLHEFGHALGLLHEHQSPSIKFTWRKYFVYWYCKFYHDWDRTKVDKNIFEEFEKTETKFLGVDKKSIMAYWIPPDFTMERITFPLNYELSEMDKEFIGKVYPLPGKNGKPIFG